MVLMMVVAVTAAADPVLVLGPALASNASRSASWSGVFIAALGAGSVLGSLRRSNARLPCTWPRPPSQHLASAWRLSCYRRFLVQRRRRLPRRGGLFVANSATRTLLAKEAGPERRPRNGGVGRRLGRKQAAGVAYGRILASLIGIRATGVLLAAPALIPILVLLFWPSFGRWLARSRGDG